MKQKIRLVLVPFLTIAICFIIIYTFLHWLLIIRLGLLNPKDELVELWLPLLLPIVPVWIWLRPRLKLLVLERKGKDNTFGYYLVAMLAIGAPSIIAQMYIHTATGKLTSLGSVNDIGRQPATMYYTIHRHFIDKENAGIKYTYEVGGKYNGDLNLHLYIACPIYDIDKAPAKVDAKEDNGYADALSGSNGPAIFLDGVRIDNAIISFFEYLHSNLTD